MITIRRNTPSYQVKVTSMARTIQLIISKRNGVSAPRTERIGIVYKDTQPISKQMEVLMAMYEIQNDNDCEALIQSQMSETQEAV